MTILSECHWPVLTQPGRQCWYKHYRLNKMEWVVRVDGMTHSYVIKIVSITLKKITAIHTYGVQY